MNDMPRRGSDDATGAEAGGLVSMVVEQLRAKDDQIEEKDRQIEARDREIERPHGARESALGTFDRLCLAGREFGQRHCG